MILSIIYDLEALKKAKMYHNLSLSIFIFIRFIFHKCKFTAISILWFKSFKYKFHEKIFARELFFRILPEILMVNLRVVLQLNIRPPNQTEQLRKRIK